MPFPQSFSSGPWHLSPSDVWVPEREWGSAQRVMKLIYDWCHDGTLTAEQVERVSVAYNGRRP